MTLNDAASQTPAFLDGRVKPMLIGGQWVQSLSGRTFEARNPANGALLATIAEGDSADIDRAVHAARSAFDGPWRTMKPDERQMILLRLADLVERHFDELSLLDTLDMGAPLRHTRGSKRHMLGLLRYFASMAVSLYGQTASTSLGGDLFACTLREPVGVVGAIVPWNGPLMAAIWKTGPVLATGCTLVLKPAEDASLTPLRFGELLLEAGVPEGVVNIVPGFGTTAGAALAAHPDVDKVSFTGSHVTGQQIVRASAGNLKRLSLELGGKSPNIVFSDADLDRAAPAAAIAAFANAGQICSAGTRLFIQRPVFDEFVEAVSRAARALQVGDGLDATTDIGPLVSAKQLDRVTGYLRAGKEEGARAMTGGARLDDDAHRNGFFVPPTVFTDIRDGMRIAQEEIFGPVVAAIPFDTVDEVVARANATPYGLGAGVWTRDVGRAHAIAPRIRSGSVWVNCYNTMDPSMPFGGYKMSGYGRESGTQQLDDYLNTKALWIRRE
ncbi:aldehyde dehydrogenase family protein [Burkholderia gladioli pv. gladioli]|uniref:Aldehyde dehydrogenase family protein n=2 Tax=Burkholderia gladioli TaxID=28095 RepID=A0AAW3EW83_BURGA|nr:aldehyde dehydrogenase family protein [Burkholderia gladioli]AJW98859.1 aldehyde dehydrogenase family protein [Burkholderia gladioli]KGC10937.1 aldehyde dehydrogenase family protein [Burkholderia gladioli]MDJ1164132.1 aldehyde dehydrogenase family protein [Burkholderia gladioli pv. gladioli]QPQ84251.1 aldehyde dehydrogenase family protein [Burkholderia gladioli]